MASTPEAKVKKAVRKLLDSIGCYYVMPVTGGYGAQGAPDFLVCCNGKFVGIETKAGRGKTTLLQDLNLQKIRDAGGVALVIYETDLETLKETLYKLQLENERES